MPALNLGKALTLPSNNGLLRLFGNPSEGSRWQASGVYAFAIKKLSLLNRFGHIPQLAAGSRLVEDP